MLLIRVSPISAGTIPVPCILHARFSGHCPAEKHPMTENNSPRVIAGHHMVETPHGTACRDCGRRLVDLFAARRQDIGSEGWAHYGCLNANELQSIEDEKARIWGHTSAVASGAGIGGTLPGELSEQAE